MMAVMIPRNAPILAGTPIDVQNPQYCRPAARFAKIRPHFDRQGLLCRSS